MIGICGGSHDCAQANKLTEMIYGNIYTTYAIQTSKALCLFISYPFAYKHGAMIYVEFTDTAD